MLNSAIMNLKESKMSIGDLGSTLRIENSSDSEVRIVDNKEGASVYFGGTSHKCKVTQESDKKLGVTFNKVTESKIHLSSVNMLSVNDYIYDSDIYLKEVKVLDIFQINLKNVNMYVEDCKSIGYTGFDFSQKNFRIYFKNESCCDVVISLLDMKQVYFGNEMYLYVSKELKDTLTNRGYPNGYEVVNWEKLDCGV